MTPRCRVIPAGVIPAALCWWLSGVLLALSSAWSPVAATVSTPSANAVHLTLLHLNDCYELMPSGGTDLGGVARVSTLRKQLLAANPNTYTVLAGDLFSPSALGSTPIPNTPQGVPYNGMQMVAGMNAIGLDYACLGNHETDVKVSPFRKNLAASNFTWLSANARNLNYTNLNTSAMIHSKPQADNGHTVKLGIVGLTIDSNNKDYESYWNFSYSSTTVANAEIASLKAQGADLIVGLTHWAAGEDQIWTQSAGATDIALVLGGHEHSVIRIETPGLASIYKADSNVKSVWIHELWIDPTVPKSDPAHCIHQPRLVMINASLDMDPTAQAIVQPYLDAAYASYAVSGFNVSVSVCLLSEPLDLRAQALATAPTLGSSLFAQSIYRSAVVQLAAANLSIPVDLAFFNVGTLRPDDILSTGTLLSQYDVLRIAPFLNLVSVCEISGILLQSVLNIGMAQAFNGLFYSSQFLAWTNVTVTTTAGAGPSDPVTYNWFINGAALDVGRNYTLAATDYLIGFGQPAGPSPYGALNAAASPRDFRVLFEGTRLSVSADPRIFFTLELRERFPLPYTPPTPPPASGPRARVSFTLALPFLTASNLTARMPRDISLALQIRLDRVTLVSLSSQRPNTRVVFLIAANTSPDPTSALQAADSFVTQSNNPSSALFQQESLQATVAGSVSIEIIDAGSSSTGGQGCEGGAMCGAAQSRGTGWKIALMLVAVSMGTAAAM